MKLIRDEAKLLSEGSHNSSSSIPKVKFKLKQDIRDKSIELTKTQKKELK